ncbi:MAG TPA: 2Fe-2S iron-sulfur cluster-binding protein [Afifellaceae bacterium]|nr:2Fe-2S iron-sulfur cluster-binding protein [Afifellaceae bacterium]
MSKCNLTINGKQIRANIGDTLIDAGIGGRILIPHDCFSGQCETCRVTVASGAVDDCGSADGDTVLACQATVDGDATVTFDDVPMVRKRSGIVGDIRVLAADVMEVIVWLSRPFDYLPGQYVSLGFRGFPARDYSPTVRMNGELNKRELVFHIKRLPGGIVSSQLGTGIRGGHRVQIRGPFGQAFLREPNDGGVLVLVSSGTGFAPIWSIARAACQAGIQHDTIVIAGARDMAGLYMRSALDWLTGNGFAGVIATSRLDRGGRVRLGRPDHYLPLLGQSDIVHVAGAPRFVDAINAKVRKMAARCYADPFLPSRQASSLRSRLFRVTGQPAQPLQAAE